MVLRICPVTLKQANDFVRRLHRHNKPVAGYRFAIGCEAEVRTLERQWSLCGVVIVGRPVSPKLDDGRAAEITRLCTDGTPNACSMLYAAARRAARAMGLGPVYTYTLPDEGGASLRAAGFHLDKTDAGGPARLWRNRPGRTVESVGNDLFGGKWRWTDQPKPATTQEPSHE
jgi:hypothetical protein